MAAPSKNPNAVALIKWLTKKGIEKIQEEHQQAFTGRDNQLPKPFQPDRREARISLDPL